MSDKIQMTEEQARELFEYLGFSTLSGIIKDLKKGNYIIKSELQQKVEEAEKMYGKWESCIHLS